MLKEKELMLRELRLQVSKANPWRNVKRRFLT